MKLLIATDMEGISGVVNWDQVTPGHAEYARFRLLMTQEVNAAIRGAFEAGAGEVLVTDGHWAGSNLLIEELDRRVRLNSGDFSPLQMVQGIDDTVQGVLLVGYHARAGTPNAILDHTWSSSTVANLWLNGTLMGEAGLNAAVCGHFGAPVLMVSGDQAVCAEAMKLLGQIEVVVVKNAVGRMVAECLAPVAAQEKICEAAARAVGRLAHGQAPEPFRLSTPVQVEVELFNSDMADRASLLPETRRQGGRRIEFMADDALQAYQWFISAVGLARR